MYGIDFVSIKEYPIEITLLNEQLRFLCPDVVAEPKKMDLKGNSVAQICCNNGRVLLSFMQLEANSGVGFDIAENIINQATDTAKKAGIDTCAFISRIILGIDEQYDNSFVLIFDHKKTTFVKRQFIELSSPK